MTSWVLWNTTTIRHVLAAVVRSLATEPSKGRCRLYKHASAATGTEMMFSVYVPLHDEAATLPVVWFLSGLSYTHANIPANFPVDMARQSIMGHWMGGHVALTICLRHPGWFKAVWPSRRSSR